MTRRFLILLLFFCLVGFGCQHQTERAFYYWKTVFYLSPAMEKRMAELHVRKLYIRFFDVAWNENSATTEPVGKVAFRSPVPKPIEVVPVVYITNKTFQKTPAEKIDALANEVLKLVVQMAGNHAIRFTELQIDCDWSETTRDRYFQFLSHLRQSLLNNKISLSATIRLHQVKYPEFTGIPPVDRGMLMFYNMGKLSATGSNNSIYNASDAARYVAYTHKYKLPLDVALPLFSWGIRVRNNQIVDLLSNFSLSEYQNTANFRPLSPTEFVAIKSFFLHGLYFVKDDRIRIEKTAAPQCLEAAQQLKPELRHTNRSVALFHLDSLTIFNNEKESLDEIYRTLD